jgi:hypothetical protein
MRRTDEGALPMILRIAALLLVLCGPTAAVAGTDLCWFDNTNSALYRFTKLKIPKKPGEAVPLVGQAFTQISVTGLPLYGTLLRDENTGSLVLGFTRTFQTCLIGAVLDADDLDGTISYDCNLDGANDGSVALAFVPDCVLF